MKYLKIFTDFLDVSEAVSNAGMGRLFRAMLRYARDGAEPQLAGKEAVLWAVARQHIDREKETYDSKVKHLQRGHVSVSRKKTLVSEEDKDNDNDKNKYNDKNNDNDIYIGPAVPAPKAHIYIEPPSPEEIESYCRERGNRVDPGYFYNYYRSNGWRVGRNPMQDWKAAVRAWESNGLDRKPAPSRETGAGDNFKRAMELLDQEEAKQP